VTCLGYGRQETEVLQHRAGAYEDQMQAAVVEVAVWEQAQGAAVRATRCHHHHDALVVTLHVF